ncbi:NHS-like protein 3 isoform X2 [Trichomycterus rosablanca]|uniref:NHS-like protein 3 isoform X2 n=1 Tax=Trichomycterus rosablanca TaxID=2290929 RepID=UPI002F35E383
MSSGQESMGDLIPPDMLEIFAQERQSKRGKRTRRRGSISKAFTWFKIRRRKTQRLNKEVHIELLTPGSPVEIPLPPPNKASKVESEPTLPVQHFQENVFIEGDRPKYVQDLMSEAREGLKYLQQNDGNGLDFQDDQSVISSVTARTDDTSFSELRMSESEFSAADTISTRSMRSTRSSVSYQSARSGLTRQGSSFGPLKEDRKHGKRSKVRSMGVAPGIPRHVQKELGLDRAAWTASQFTSAQLSSGGVSISTVVPTLESISVASELDGALEHLQNMNSLEPQLQAEGQKCDLANIQHFLPQSLDPQKPGSLGVPWVTTSDNCPPSSVMYVSPEAMYKNQMIYNAYLPPSVDVVELKRNRSRSSVRMVSKSSLASASPAPSRASSRASSRFSSRPSSRFSSRLHSQASSYRTGPLSEGSLWSNSGSSETLISDSSTISNSSNPRLGSRESQREDGETHLNVNINQPIHFNGGNRQGETFVKSGTTAQFSRSLSVTKKNKKPPPPPRRSNSLHTQNFLKSQKTKAGAGSVEDTSGSNGSLKVVSPYSAYISSSAGGKPISHTNGKSHWTKLKESLPYVQSLAAKGTVPSPSLIALMALLDIPDPPHVLAPQAPPPETWAHNQRTFHLLCGSGPVNLEHWAQKRGLKIEIFKTVSAPNLTRPTKWNGAIVSSKPVKGTLQGYPPLNGMKDNSKAPNKKLITQSQEAKISDIQNRTPLTKVSSDVLPNYGKTVSLSLLTRVCPTPTPPPPPEHIPPLPPTNQVKDINETVSAQKVELRAPSEELICPPPHPLFPPPLPPGKIASPHLLFGQDKTDFSFAIHKIPPPPQGIPPPPQGIPPLPPAVILPPPSIIPPPPQVIPTPPPPVFLPPPPTVPPPPQVIPPPPQAIPPPPTEIPPPPQAVLSSAALSTPKVTQEVSSMQSKITSTANIPPPPPLPTDIKKEVRAIITDQQEKHQRPPTPQNVAAKEESPTPVVTQSLLQMVRLRSVRSNQQSNQEAPPKPMRRSLILSDTLLSTGDLKDNSQLIAFTQEVHDTPQVQPQPAAFEPTTAKPNGQTSSTDQETQNTSTDPIKESKPADPTPTISGEENKNAATEELVMPDVEPKDQLSIIDLKAKSNEPELQNGSSKIEDKPSTTLLQSSPKPQTLILTSPKLSPTQKMPPASIPPSSMRLQEAIRLKTAAMSSKDNQSKRLSLHSPPPSVGGISPTSTANFIFSKSTKKVVIETASSPEAQAGLRRTLVSELASVSQTTKPPGLQTKNTKVPPPVAKKPSSKSENTDNPSETESNADTEHVQTAGQ